MKLRSRSKGLARVIPLTYWGGRAGSLALLLTALLLFSISVIRPGAMEKARVGTLDLFAPLLAVVSQPFHTATDYVRAVSGIAALQAENTRLEQENARLREWYQTALTLKAENESLQNLLNVKIEPQYGFVTARVIADPGNAFAQSLVVLAGRDDGVENGGAVLAGDGLVGRVLETGSRTARVLLLNDINSRVPVLIQGTNQRAILGGNNGDLLDLLHLPPGAEIEEGARVVTSGHGGYFPYGLPVGVIVRDGQSRPTVKPYTDTSQIYMVRVIDRIDDPNLRPASGGALP